MVALDYFRRLGHDNHRRLSKLYAWEKKKSTTSWGAETVDYEKRVSGFVLANPESKNVAAAVQSMKADDVNRFLVVCALASDLYCPGYNPSQTLSKDSNLARTAIRYKIDVGRVAAAVRADLTKNKKTKDGETNSKTSPKTRSGQREPTKARTTK